MNNSILDVFSLIKKNDFTGLNHFFKEKEFDINTYLSPSLLQNNEELIDYMYYTPLYLATKLNNEEIAELLLKNGADFNKVISENGGIFASSYDYAVLNNNENLTELFNRYSGKSQSLCSVRTKERPKNVKTINFQRKRKKVDSGESDLTLSQNT